MGHVFISYSHRDSKYAHALAAHLHEMGFGVWIDERLDYGSQWPHEIQKQLDACDAFILVMTPRSFASEWVQSELQRARRKLKPIFPLLLEGDEPWLSVESTQYYDVRGERFPDEKFYAALKRVVTPGSASSTLKFKNVERRPVWSSSWKVWTAGAFLTICIVVPVLVLGWRFVASNLPISTASSIGTELINMSLPVTETPGITSSPATIPPTHTVGVPSNTTEPPAPSSTPVTPTLTLTPTRPTPTSMPDTALYGWWSSEREDNLVSTLWSNTSTVQSPDYIYIRTEGYVFSPNGPQPRGTVPLYTWYSPSRGDNFATTAPVWTGDTSTTRSPDYYFVYVEGYIYDPDLPQPPNTVPVYSWWSGSRQDNFTTSTPGWSVDLSAIKPPDYSFVRLEGYIRQP